MTARCVSLIAALVLALASCSAQEIAVPQPPNLIANPGFEEPDLTGWSRVLAGDQAGVIEPTAEAAAGAQAACIEAPTDRAWSFLRQQNFDVALGETLVLTASVRSRSSQAKLVLTGGYLWGGDPSGHQTSAARHSGSGDWERLRVALTVEQLPVSAAIGFDYGSAGGVLIVDDVRLAREGDVLAEEGVACAARFVRLAERDDLPEWIRAGLVARGGHGRELVRRLLATARDEAGYGEMVAALREYVATEHQLVTWARGDAPTGDDGEVPLALRQIALTARSGGEATATISMLNAFGAQSVAVRIEPGKLTDAEGAAAVPAERIRVEELIPVGGHEVAVDPGEDRAVWAPVNELRGVRLTVPAAGLAPGTYTGTLLLRPLDREQAGPPQEVAVELTVHG